jgi:DNA-damage-inducible protein D
METKGTVFRDTKIRRTIHENECWFSVSDVVGALTDSTDPERYIKRMKQRDRGLNSSWDSICTLLEILTLDGKMEETDCANLEGIFRIIQSISSPKAEPFKRQLAKVGCERIYEGENPELGAKRRRARYREEFYSGGRAKKGTGDVSIRRELIEEWENRGVTHKKEHAILAAEIAKGAFGVIPGESKKRKRLKRGNLRDHMTDLESIFSMLGEAATIDIARVDDARGFQENREAARKGGEVVGKARKDLEQKTGKRIVPDLQR